MTPAGIENLRRQRDGFTVDTDPARLDVDRLHAVLTDLYWSKGRSREVVERSIAGSVNFGLYEDASGKLVGYGRVVTDFITFAWISDVYVEEGYRGRGLGRFLVEAMMAHPALDLPTMGWHLGTRDAHALYRRFGFVETAAGHIMRKPRTSQSLDG